MDKTGIQTSALPPAGQSGNGPPVVLEPVGERRVLREPLWKRLLRPLASLRLTVALFALAIFLVFVGTLAQVDGGIWTILSKYFRTPIAWVPFQVFLRFGQIFFGLPRDWVLPGSFPFPGGQVIGGALLLNLLAAHLVRFKISWKRAGILVIHSGLIILLLSEVVTTFYAVESSMVIANGESVNFVDITHPRQMQLTIIDRNGPETTEVTVPEHLLRQGGPIQHDELPFDVTVERWMDNSILAKVQPGDDNPATAGDGLRLKVIGKDEVSGAAAKQGIDMPSAYVTFRKKGSGESLGTYLVSLWFYSNATLRQLPDRPQRVSVDGRSYDVFLRFKRAYKPYTLHLVEFKHERYEGTNMAKEYSSKVRLMEEDREVVIRMNHPLYYQGETFFQSGVLPGDTGTILQVVRNPGWLMPYIACGMVALGMLVHFSTHLIGFLSQRVVK
jgi:hypothetical protein